MQAEDTVRFPSPFRSGERRLPPFPVLRCRFSPAAASDRKTPSCPLDGRHVAAATTSTGADAQEPGALVLAYISQAPDAPFPVFPSSRRHSIPSPSRAPTCSRLEMAAPRRKLSAPPVQLATEEPDRSRRRDPGALRVDLKLRPGSSTPPAPPWRGTAGAPPPRPRRPLHQFTSASITSGGVSVQPLLTPWTRPRAS
jgi:hypothetical protein